MAMCFTYVLQNVLVLKSQTCGLKTDFWVMVSIEKKKSIHKGN